MGRIRDWVKSVFLDSKMMLIQEHVFFGNLNNETTNKKQFTVSCTISLIYVVIHLYLIYSYFELNVFMY